MRIDARFENNLYYTGIRTFDSGLIEGKNMNVFQTTTGQANILSIGKFLTTAEACQELGTLQSDGTRKPITESRIRALVQAGKLTRKKFGNVNAFDEKEVKALQAERDQMQLTDAGRIAGGRPKKEGKGI